MEKQTATIKVIRAKPVVPPPVYQLTINLTEREAIAFHSLCRKIGGNPDQSARGMFDKIHDKLIGVVPHNDNAITFGSSITFRNYDSYPDVT